MALRNLSADEMLAISSIWLERHAARMKAVPEIAPFIPKAQSLHNALGKAAQSALLDPTLGKLAEDAQAADAQHDRAIRGLWNAFNAHVELVRARGGPNAERDALAIERERDQLLPTGLAATRVTYLAESGAAQRLADQIKPELRDKLAKRRIADGTFDELITLWIDAGNRLGEIERKRAGLNQGAPSGLLTARNSWISFMNTALEVLALSDADPDAVRALRDPVVDAANRAESPTPDAPPSPPNPTPLPDKPPTD